MRSNQKLLIEKKRFEEDDQRKREELKKTQIMRSIQSFSTKILQRDFRGGMANADRGQVPTVSQKIQKKRIEEFQRKKMSRGGRKDFEKYRKELEE